MSAQTNAQAPVDVLALFDALDGNTTSLKLNSQVYFARDAVAELIEAVKGERWARENNVPTLTLINAVNRTDAALARVRGGR